jgi:non-canonical (house-cleaning) NTP pyrophosphatase
MTKIASLVIGSTSIHKIDAVEKACDLLGVCPTIVGIKADSGQNEQPIGFEETLAGATTRAEAARAHDPNSFAIGIESGILSSRVCLSPITIDFAVVVLIEPNGHHVVTTSTGIEFPEECYIQAEKKGFDTTTVGSIVQERFGGDGTNPHAVLTGNKLSRKKFLTDAVYAALIQIPVI